MTNLAKLFDDRFDIEDGEEGVSLICNECAETFKVPSIDDAIEVNEETAESEFDATLHATQVIELVQRILAHLDICKPEAP